MRKKSREPAGTEKGASMDANSWVWVALIAFLFFCCLPMIFMRHDHRSDEKGSADGEHKP